MRNFFFVLFACLCFLTKAQPSHTFTQYTSENGFDQSTVSSIIQDQKGFIWLATWDGIYRFDGHRFLPYKNRINVSGEFISNRISSLEEDSYGCIWALGYDKRLSRLNPYIEQLTSILNDEYFVRKLFILPNGHTWIATENKGLILATSNTEDLHLELSLETNLLPGEYINHIELNTDGNEWILTETGLFIHRDGDFSKVPVMSEQAFTDMQEIGRELFFSADKGKIWKYSKETQQYELLQLPTSSHVVILLALEENKLFCGTESDGFFIITTVGNNIRHFRTSTCKSMPDNSIKAVYRDQYGELWIQQKSKGVTLFNPETEEIHKMEIRDKYGNLFSDGRLYQIIREDSKGNLFIHPTGGGFAYYDRASRKLIPFYNKQLSDGWQESDLIMDVYLDKQDNIWISSHANGLEKITFKDNSFHLYTPQELRAQQNNNRALFIDKDKRLWIGFKHKGVGVYDSNHAFLGYLQNDGTLSLKGNNLKAAPYSIMQDHRGDIWIGTKKYGIIRLEAQNGSDRFKLSRFMFNEKDPYSLSNNDVFHVYEDSKHRLWCATLNGGINYLKHDEETNTYSFINHRNELKNYPIETCSRTRHILSDKQGKLWVATSNGLLVMDENFKHVSDIEFELIKHIPGNSQSLNNNDIQFLYLTKQQQLYVATFGGGLNHLLSFQDDGAKFECYTKEDGLLSNILLSMEESPDGNLWIVMTEGLSKYNPHNKTFENYSSREFPEFIRFNDGAGCYSEKDEALLFNTQQGVLWFRPDSLQKSGYVPPIVFTQLQLGDKIILPGDSTEILHLSIDDTDKLILKHHQHSFSIEFSALDLRNPNDILYAYRLKGFEEIWNQAGSTHTANYTNIPKGNYILEVRSTNSDGIQTGNVRQLPIQILPSFWETPWAIILYILLLGAIIFITVRILFTFYRLRHEVKMEKKLADLKLQFFTNISHELRTPLTLISGPIKNILDQNQLAPDIYNQLALVDRNTNRMTHLINQILDFQKIQSSKMKMQVQQIELISFLRHLMGYFQTLAEKQQIDFSLHAGTEPLLIWADADKLEKIFFNLISNAFKYTPAGKQIMIRVKEENQKVLIEIEDQGIGISADKQKQLFERFETVFQSKGSTGIGLSLAKEFVEMHKGKIYLESEPGKGSNFMVELIKGKDHLEDASTEYISSSTEALSSADKLSKDDNSEKKVMLIVEDNNELRSFLRSIFEKEYNVVEAENGKIALEATQKHIPDMIISDVMMPEKDGIEFLSDLRSDVNISHIPFILLSAKSSIESRIKGIELGADDYITKPFSATYLKTRISNLLELREKLQQHYRTLLAIENPFADSITGTITSNNQAFMNRLIKSIEKHIGNGDLKIEELAQETGMSRAVFFKKVKSLTGLSPIEYLKDVRLKRAAHLMKTSDLTISQIAYHVGFNDAHYFSKCFKQQFGVTPTEYRESEG